MRQLILQRLVTEVPPVRAEAMSRAFVPELARKGFD
jgi:hypothetical protein